VVHIESFLPLQELRGGHCISLLKNLSLIDRLERFQAINYAKRFITDEMDEAERIAIFHQVFRLYKLAKNHDLEKLASIISPDMTVKERVEIFRKIKSLKLNRGVIDQLLFGITSEMSGSDKIQLIISNATQVFKVCRVNENVARSKSKTTTMPISTVKMVTVKEPVVEKKVPIEEILFIKSPEERPAILNCAKEIAPDSIGMPGFINLVEIIANLEIEERIVITEHVKVLAKGRLSISDCIEIAKTIIGLDKNRREENLAQVKVLISERMSVLERIKLIKTIEGIKSEDRNLVIPQAQNLFGQMVGATEIGAVLVIDKDERLDAITDTKELLSRLGYTTSKEKTELLKTVVGLETNKAHVLTCVRALRDSTSDVSELISLLNTFSEMRSDDKRVEVTEKIRELRSPTIPFSFLLGKFSNTDIVNILFEIEAF
jgi:hypothetical protein